MIYKKYEHPNYNVIGIKNNLYKSCFVEVIFRKNISKHDLVERFLLSDTLCFSTKNYPIKKDLNIKCQDLYDTNIFASVSKLGNVIETSFKLCFICPKFIKEEEYLEEVIKLLFEIIFNPNTINNSFDLKSFNVIKKQLITDIEDINENPGKVSITNALSKAFKNSVTSYTMKDEIDYLESLNPDNLYNIYLDMINNDLCDIFVIGDLDLDKTNDLISKYYKNNIIKTTNLNLYVKNPLVKKPREFKEKGKFVQSNLIMIYNIDDLDKKDLHITQHVFNHIFGNDSLNSKLFRYLREENSLCYGVGCMYLRFDGIFVINVSLAYDNIKKAIELVKKALKEMIKGDFTDEDLEQAKKSSIFSIKIGKDYIGSLLNNYITNYYDDFPLPEERIKLVNSLSREDIMRYAKSLKLNSIYILKELENEGN